MNKSMVIYVCFRLAIYGDASFAVGYIMSTDSGSTAWMPQYCHEFTETRERQTFSYPLQFILFIVQSGLVNEISHWRPLVGRIFP
jgi:hypothetical protein